MRFAAISPAPPDAILGLTEAFKQDPRPAKVNLGVGVFMDEQGHTPVLASVKQAEERWWRTQRTKSYLPIVGEPAYARGVQELVIGAGHPALAAQRVRTAHTPGGTGALRVGAEFLRKFAPQAKVWLSAPTWPNHKGIFTAAGFATAEYPYYDAAGRGLDAAGLLGALRAVPAGDIVLLHVCCHNPTGVDLTAAQWREVAAIARERQWLPFFDFAYQGFGEGLVEDRAAVAAMLETDVEFLVASSFSKNFGLYCDRVGALTLVGTDAAAVEAAFSHVKTVVRVLYSNPAAHGGAIVMTILGDAALRAQWEAELTAMRQRIASVRAELVAALKRGGAAMDFSFITRQRGMFSFSGLSDAQVAWLRNEKAIYMVGGGRINVAGILPGQLEYLAAAMVEALSR